MGNLRRANQLLRPIRDGARLQRAGELFAELREEALRLERLCGEMQEVLPLRPRHLAVGLHAPGYVTPHEKITRVHCGSDFPDPVMHQLSGRRCGTGNFISTRWPC